MIFIVILQITFFITVTANTAPKGGQIKFEMSNSTFSWSSFIEFRTWFSKLLPSLVQNLKSNL